MKIEIYSDGSATTVDKPGGWAWVITVDGEKHSEGSGYCPNATNNDMELQGAIQGLKASLQIVNSTACIGISMANETFHVVLCSDSQLTLGWASGEYRFNQL